MTHLLLLALPAWLTATVDNLPSYIAVATAVTVVLGTLGLALSKLGTALIGTSWAPLRGLGHAVFFVGDMLTSIYSHWPDIAAALGNLAKAMKPKGPGGGAAAALVFAIAICLPFATECGGHLPDAASSAAAGAKARAALHVTYSSATHTSDELREAWSKLTASAIVIDPDVAAKVTASLDKTDALLTRAKPWVVDGTGDEAQAKRDLADGVRQLLELVALLDGLGQKTPPAVVDGLVFAEKALGGE